MNKQTKALKMAIEGMKWLRMRSPIIYEELEAEKACKEALEQPPPKVEPFDVWAGTKPQEDVPIVFPRWDNGEPFEVRYPKQPAQKPVAWMNDKTPSGVFARHKEGADNFGCDIPLYTHPAPSWQGLSDDEIKSFMDVWGITKMAILDIEASLKEKNI